MTAATLAAVSAAVCAAVAVWQLDHSGRLRTTTRPVSTRRLGRAVGTVRGRPPAMHGLAAVVSGTAGLVVGGTVAAVVVGAVGATASVYRLRRAAVAAERRRERASPALARALADALRGGASIRGALVRAGADLAVPAALRTEVAGFGGAIDLGAPLAASLDQLAGRGGAGLRLLCGTVAMHVESGGALATELDRLAADGEAALRIEEDRIAATAQARATVRVVAALPVLALIAAEAASGSFVQTIARNPVALALLTLGFVLEIAAMLAARVIVGGRR